MVCAWARAWPWRPWARCAVPARVLDSTLRLEVTYAVVSFPVWPARIVIAIGFMLLALHCTAGKCQPPTGPRAYEQPRTWLRDARWPAVATGFERKMVGFLPRDQMLAVIDATDTWVGQRDRDHHQHRYPGFGHAVERMANQRSGHDIRNRRHQQARVS